MRSLPSLGRGRKTAAVFAFLTFSILRGQAASELPACPPNWTLTVAAEAPQVRHPSVVCAAPDGRVFVAEDPMDISAPADARLGRILCLHPGGALTVFAEGLHAVFGMQYLEGKLYVLHNPKFSVFEDDGGAGRNRKELIESTNPNPWALDWNDHVPANFRLGLDGYFYAAVGDKGLYGAAGTDGRRVDLYGGGIVRIRPDGAQMEIFSRGVRNILDVALNEEDEIFTYDNTDEREWMGRLTHMVDGGFYGYPYDFIPRRPYTLWMMADYGGGAATGTLAYNEDALPAEYHGNLFLADFGKRQILRVRVAREGASYKADEGQDIFRDPPADFRPVGIGLSADGMSIYICDWNHRDVKADAVVGRLLKLTYTGPSQAAPKPGWYLPASMGKEFRAASEELIRGLDHPSHQVRLTAQRMLARRPEAADALRGIVIDPNRSRRARMHAIWALDQLTGKPLDHTLLQAVRAGGDAAVRRQAIRQAGTRGGAGAGEGAWLEEWLRPFLTDPEVSIRFYAATALGRIGSPNVIPWLRERLGESDLFLRFGVFTALNRVGRAFPEAWGEVVRGLESSDGRVREGTFFALRETYDSKLIEALARIAEDPARLLEGRRSALELMSSLQRQYKPWRGEWWAYHPAYAPAPEKTIAWSESGRILQALRDAFESPEPSLRLIAIEGLRSAKDAGQAARLRRAFDQEKDVEIRRAILAALGDFQDRAAAALLEGVMRDAAAPGALAQGAVEAAEKIGGEELGRAVLDFAKTRIQDAETRLAVIRALAALKPAGAGEAIVEMAREGSRDEKLGALEALGVLQDARLLPRIAGLLKDPDIEVRKKTISVLPRFKDPSVLPTLLRHYEAEEGTRAEVIAAAAQIPDRRALEPYLEGLASKNPAAREAVRKALGSIQGEVLGEIENRAARLAPEVILELRKVYDANPKARQGNLFSAAAPGLGLEDYGQFALKNAGDAAAGQRLFYEPNGMACFKCHAVGGQGGTAGPDLTRIGTQSPREELIASILYPSKVVREGYHLTIVETKNDEVVSGILKSESPEAVDLVDADGRARRVAKSDIRDRRRSELSLMPEGLHAGLTLVEFADLIAFLESRRAPAP